MSGFQEAIGCQICFSRYDRIVSLIADFTFNSCATLSGHHAGGGGQVFRISAYRRIGVIS